MNEFKRHNLDQTFRMSVMKDVNGHNLEDKTSRMTGMKDFKGHNLQSLIWKNQVLSGWHLNVIFSVEASNHVNIWENNLNIELI